MPKEIENYVHRIGRTGRCGKTGVATTFINKSCEETILLDLKCALVSLPPGRASIALLSFSHTKPRKPYAAAACIPATGQRKPCAAAAPQHRRWLPLSATSSAHGPRTSLRLSSLIALGVRPRAPLIFLRRHLLLEAKQRIPPVLATLEDPNDAGGGGEDELSKGCAFCGGLGHRVATCPKLEAHRMKQMRGGGADDLAGNAARQSGGAGTDW